MKRLFWIVVFLSVNVLTAWAQTQVNITGVVSGATSGYVQFNLLPTNSGIQYFVQGVATIAPQTKTCSINGTGAVVAMGGGTCTVWGNDVITPANTLYQVVFAPGGTVTNRVNNQLITGSNYSLNTPVFGNPVKIVPQYQTITAPPISVNLIPAAPHTFTLGTAGTPYSAAYIDNIFATNINTSGVSNRAVCLVGADTATMISNAYASVPAGGIIDCSNARITSTFPFDPFAPMTKQVTVIMPPGVTNAATAINVPANVNVQFYIGSILNNNNSTTYNGSVQSGLYQIFSGSGQVTLPQNNAQIYPQWFGALGDNAHDDTAAIQAAVSAALAGGSRLFFPAGNYRISNSINILIPYTCTTGVMNPLGNPCGLAMFGSGVQKTTIVMSQPSLDAFQAVSTMASNQYYQIEDLSIRGPDTFSPRTTTSGNGIRISGTSIPFIHMKNVAVNNFEGAGKAGIWLDNVEDSLLDHIRLQADDIGLKLTNSDNNIQINMGTFQFNQSNGINCSGSGGVDLIAPLIQSNEKTGAVWNCHQSHFVNPWFEGNGTSNMGMYFDIDLTGYSNTFTSPVFNGGGETQVHMGTSSPPGGNTFTSTLGFGCGGPGMCVNIDSGMGGNTWIGGSNSWFSGAGATPFIETIIANGGVSVGVPTITSPQIVTPLLGINATNAVPNAPLDLRFPGSAESLRFTDSTNATSYVFYRLTSNGGGIGFNIGANFFNGGEASIFSCEKQARQCVFVGGFTVGSFTFANLPAAGQLVTNGSMLYCSDCKNVHDDAVVFDSTVASGGHGTMVVRENSDWRVH